MSLAAKPSDFVLRAEPDAAARDALGILRLSLFDWGLGQDWRMERVSHKFHACCHGLHAMLEALASLRGVDPGEVEAVSVRTNPRWLSVCTISDPLTGLECTFSFRHTAAMALTGRSTAALDSCTDPSAADPGLARLRRSVEVQADDSLAETASKVVLRLRAGAR